MVDARHATRWTIVLALGLGLIFVTVRNAVFTARSGTFLSSYQEIFRSHPAQLRSRLQLAAAVAAKSGKPLSSGDRHDAVLLLQKEPLSSLPLLLAGAGMQLNGDETGARRAYEAARHRDPRDPAARYLLSDALLRSGRLEAGLEELLVLGRVARNSTGLVEAVAAFAKQPNTQADLRGVFARNPDLQSQVLNTLASDVGNARLVLSLAPRTARDRLWELTLINAFINADEVQEGYRLWAQFSGDSDEEIAHLGDFRRAQFRPPFDWQFPATNAGIVETNSRDGLKIIFYGRENAVFARELRVLRPGRYEIRTAISGSPDTNIKWQIQCSSGEQLATAPISAVNQFTVPEHCVAVWFNLIAEADDASATQEFSLKEVAVTWTGD